jgi:hypothetical protein
MFSDEIKAQIVGWSYALNSPIAVQRLYRQMYGNFAPTPPKGSIRDWRKKFEQTGSVCRKKKGKQQVGI